jgi:hypothetical protein
MKRSEKIKRITTLLTVMAICMIGLQVVSAPRARAEAPVSFGSNFYEFVQVTDPFTGDNNSWATASAAASASVYNGLSGHLATITSQDENDFLFGLVSGSFSKFNGAWLGGKAPGEWLVGSEAGQGFSYTNWGGIEPNNAGYSYMNIGTLPFVIGPGQWADDSGVQGVPEAGPDPVIGYFVEYEGVPEAGIDAKVTKIYFIRKTDSGPEEINEISYDEPFYIKAVFDSESEEKEKTVTLDWGEGTDEKREIIVKQQKDNKKIFLSDIIYVKRPDSSKEGE